MGKRILKMKVSDCPELVVQWDKSKNTIDPATLTIGSGVIAWWICEKGHSWKAEVKSRIRGQGCPYCAGKKVLVGFNDLKTHFPNVANEWDYEKNTITPEQVSSCSKKMAWWICGKGHSWKAVIHSRTKGHGCPICSGRTVLVGYNDLQTLRPDITSEWSYKKNKGLPSQYTLGSNIKVWWECAKGHTWKSDIYSRTSKKGRGCPYCSGNIAITGVNDLKTLNPKLVLEWDFVKNDISPSTVKSKSSQEAWWICDKGHSYQASIYSRSKGRGCPYCAGKRVLKGFNDLQTLLPELALEWDYEKNTLKPTQVTVGSGKEIWWKCAEGHSWKTKVTYRTYGAACPFCINKPKVRVLRGVIRILKPLNEQLLKEWDYEKNELSPYKVSLNSSEYVWWKCEKGHSWKARINRRKDNDCPYCNGRYVTPGVNDLQTLYPELMKEWDWERNTVLPSELAIGASKPVWWKCKEGHSWDCPVDRRTRQRQGCPYCANQRVLEGYNDLQTTNPRLAGEWDYDKNDLLPTQVTCGTQRKFWWLCEKGHSWEAGVSSRNRGNGCPYCIGQLPYAPRCVSITT